MRGFGDKQKAIKDKIFWEIFHCISDINLKNHRYATINEIHRETKISKDIIRNHIDEGKKTIIIEYRGYNNSRYLCTGEADVWFKEKDNSLIVDENTEDYINSLKFPPHNQPVGKKRKPKKGYLKSGRGIERK